jgi:hypothetical protein
LKSQLSQEQEQRALAFLEEIGIDINKLPMDDGELQQLTGTDFHVSDSADEIMEDLSMDRSPVTVNVRLKLIKDSDAVYCEVM